MRLLVYNTLSGKKDAVKPLKGRTFRLFVCGITPYDSPHIGNARTYVVFDAFAKYLKSRGYEVFYLQNVTDVDDKIIRRAKESGTTWKALARFFEKEYLASMKALGVDSVTRYARATDYIPEIISQVERLFKKGYAYEIPGDGVYYDISKFRDYGKLSGRTLQQAEDATSRIDDSVAKRNKGDFALWKLSKQGEPRWKSPWGPGRPGWHIEDTAIAEKFFGFQYDLHGGARDLMFPHHEAEIAQMEGISGKKPFVKHWMHPGFLTVRGRKMAKSQGSFIAMRDFLAEHSPRLFRLLVLKTHWRSPMDYSDALLLQTERELERIDEFLDRLRGIRADTKRKGSPGSTTLAMQLGRSVRTALEDDFNTPEAVSYIFEYIRKANNGMDEGVLGARDARALLNLFEEMDHYVGFLLRGGKRRTAIPALVRRLAEQRERRRKNREWAKADELRERLVKHGWSVEDTPRGPKLKRLA